MSINLKNFVEEIEIKNLKNELIYSNKFSKNFIYKIHFLYN